MIICHLILLARYRKERCLIVNVIFVGEQTVAKSNILVDTKWKDQDQAAMERVTSTSFSFSFSTSSQLVALILLYG